MLLGLILACSGDDADDVPTDVVEADTDTDTDADADTDADTDSDADTDTGADVVSYDADIRPLFQQLCTTCHYPGSAGDYDLTDPWDPVSGFVGRANSWVPNGSDETVLIDPGNPDNSFLLVKITQGAITDDHVDGSQMPYLPALFSPAELADVETWIAQGALDDAFYAANVEPLFGTEITFGSRSGRCTWCHYPGSPTGLDIFDVFDPVTGLVDRPSIWGGTVVVPGDPDNSVLMAKLRGTGPGSQMPQQLRAMTPDEVALVREWILLGALED